MYDSSVSAVAPPPANCMVDDATPSFVEVSFVHARPIATLNMINWGEIGYKKYNQSEKKVFPFKKLCLPQMSPTQPQKQVPVLVVFQSRQHIVCLGQ